MKIKLNRFLTVAVLVLVSFAPRVVLEAAGQAVVSTGGEYHNTPGTTRSAGKAPLFYDYSIERTKAVEVWATEDPDPAFPNDVRALEEDGLPEEWKLEWKTIWQAPWYDSEMLPNGTELGVWETSVDLVLKGDRISQEQTNEEVGYTDANLFKGKGFGEFGVDKEFELVSLGSGGGLKGPRSLGVYTSDELKGVFFTATTSGNQIFMYRGKAETMISNVLDHRGGNIVKVGHHWSYGQGNENVKEQPAFSVLPFPEPTEDSAGKKYILGMVNEYVVTKIFAKRYFRDFRKWADISSDGASVYIMGAGRSLYDAADSLTYNNVSWELITGHRIFDGVTEYIRDVAVGPIDKSTGLRSLAVIKTAKDLSGNDREDAPYGVYITTNPTDISSYALLGDPSQMGGIAFSISYADDGTLWAIDEAYRLYVYDSGPRAWTFVETPEGVFRVSAVNKDPYGMLVVGMSNTVYLAVDLAAAKIKDKWVSLGIQVRDASLGFDGTLAVIGGGKKLYFASKAVMERMASPAEELAGLVVTIGDPVGNLLCVDSQGFVRFGKKSAADPRSQFLLELEIGGKFYLKAYNGSYLESRTKLLNEGPDSAREGTVLKATSSEKTDRCLFATETLAQGAVLKSVATGGYVAAAEHGFLRSVDVAKNFDPFVETTTILPLKRINPQGVVRFLQKARGVSGDEKRLLCYELLLQAHDLRGSVPATAEMEIAALLSKLPSLLSGEDWGYTIPAFRELEDRITLVRELEFLLDDHAARGKEWSVESSQSLNALLQHTSNAFGSSPAIQAVLRVLRRSLVGVSIVAPTLFLESFNALRSQFSQLEPETVEQFMIDIRSMVEDRIDGEDIVVIEDDEGFLQKDSGGNWILSVFKQWLEVVVDRNELVIAKGGVKKLAVDLEKPASVIERLERIERLANSVASLNENEVTRQADMLVATEPDSRLSPINIRKLKSALAVLQVQRGIDELEINITKLGTEMPTFEQFITDRRDEINDSVLDGDVKQKHSDDKGYWNFSWDHLDHMRVNKSTFPLEWYTLREFWDVLKRWKEWRPKEDFSKDMVPLKVLIKQVKASVEEGGAGEGVEDIGREAASMLIKLGVE